MSYPRVAWGSFANPEAPSGYGVISRYLRESLQKAGTEVVPNTDREFDLVVCVSLPVAWMFQRGHNPRMDLVWHTMFELYPLPADWVPILNDTRFVWVPSVWCAELFKEAGVKVPIMVAGYGIDPVYNWSATPKLEKSPMKFLTWGSTLVGRKNVLDVVRAFLRADLPPDEAELEVKLNDHAAQPMILGPGRKPYPNIKIFPQNWMDRMQVADWLRTGDCFVYASGGEGFGLMPLEAMGCGVPVIAPYHTGMMSYLSEDSALLLRNAKAYTDPSYSTRFGGETFQLRPDVDEMAEKIRYAFDHREELEAMGSRGCERAHTLFTWEVAARKAKEELELFAEATM